MAKCKFCDAEITWRRVDGKSIPYTPDKSRRHTCIWRSKIQVWCTQCRSWVDEETVEFMNIEEDIQGRDLLTFKCPCGTVGRSHRVGGR